MIGLICNYGISKEKNEIYYVYKNFFKLKCSILIIPLTNYDEIINNINKCDGIIMQGGDEYEGIHLEIIKYLYEQDIPLLAICMSMQAMGVLFNGKLKQINNHKNVSHMINIKKDSLLYRILKKDNIMVNSSHKECLEKTDIQVCAYSDCIEAIEDKSKKFFLGVQWHPEKMLEYDNLERKIFEYFKEVCDEFRRIK